MRVLIVNTSELTGGAAVASSRLADALQRQGVEVRMLVRDQQSEKSFTIALLPHWRLRWAFLWERFCIWVANRFSLQGLWAVDIANAGVDITRLPAFQQADVIHLHWVNQGLLSMRQIQKILQSGKPVVWTLHDLWPVTGVCHHPGECMLYHTHCHDCPQLQAPEAHDLSWRVFGQKLATYDKGHLAFVAVSAWTAERARESALTQGHRITVIPNVLPIDQFQPQDKAEARRQLGIPADAAVVVFGAARLDQPLKGLPRLLAALQKVVSGGRPLHLLLFGTLKDRSWLGRIPVPYTAVGRVEGAPALSRLYAAADVAVCASDYETFGQTLAEAMACGCTPVSFDRGGQTDIICHLRDGYLARYGDIGDLAAGIRWALDAHLPADMLRQSVAARFGEEAVVRQYIELYERLMA